MKRWLLGMALAALASPSQGEALGPGDVVRRTSDRVIAVLGREDLPLEERQSRVRDIAREQFDFETIPRLVLARHWRRFSHDQREAFVAEFERYLIVRYGNRIDRYEDEKVEILEERPEARGDVTVRTRVVGGDANGSKVDYRMRQRDGRWYVIDVVIEGVSAVRSFRSQFQEILNDGGPDELLARLREKNALGAEEEAGELGVPESPEAAVGS